jgi:hypothetical protein
MQESGDFDTHESIITVNQDGTTTAASLLDGGRSIVSEMHIVGSINDNALSFTEGTNGAITLLTLYPKDSIGIFTGTGYFGWRKAIPTGYVYIARCQLSKDILH